MTNKIKLLLTLLVMSGCAQLATAEESIVCCTTAEIQTIGDLNYLARAAMNHTGEYKDRLYALAMQLKAGTWRQWNDPDRGYILGLMAATPDGQYPPNRALLNEFAAEIGVTIKTVAIPAPSPVVVPSTPPTASTVGLDTAAIRAIIVTEIAKLPAQPFNGVVDHLIVKGKLCVVEPPYATDCDPDKVEQIQCRGASHCAIGFNANLSNAWRQADTPNGTGPGYVVVGVSPDLGFRVCQNQAWALSGYKDYIIAKGKGCFGFDSQAEFSIQQCGYGSPCLPGQSVVLLRQNYGWVWTAWQKGIALCLQASVSAYAAMDSNPLCTP